MRNWFAVLVCIAGTAMAGAVAIDEASLSAGTFTVTLTDHTAYSEPAPVLDRKQREIFMAGRSVFHRQWASIKSLNGDWGLGPTFIADRCVACHVNTGRGHPPSTPDEQLLSVLVRVSVPGENTHGGPKPHPNYGDQLQNRSLDGSNIDLAHDGYPVPHEANLYIDWEEHSVTLADGETVNLRRPKLRIEHAAFGPIDNVMTSLRVAQPLVARCKRPSELRMGRHWSTCGLGPLWMESQRAKSCATGCRRRTRRHGCDFESVSGARLPANTNSVRQHAARQFPRTGRHGS
jgi:CxxC motif-containing protein (DUF1111 family)